MRPVPVGVEPALRAFLEEVRSAVAELQQPGKPQQPFASTSLKLPTASDWKNCVVNVTDKNCLAISTLSSGVWTWLRADGGAL